MDHRRTVRRRAADRPRDNRRPDVTRAGATPEAGTLGPDGQAWFVSGDRLLRTGAGALSPVASLPALELGTYARHPHDPRHGLA